MNDETIAASCRTLASATRLAILQHLLKESEATPTELSHALEIGLGTIVGHLQLLRRDGFVTVTSRDARRQYAVKKRHFESEFESALCGWAIAVLTAPENKSVLTTGMEERLELPRQHAEICAAVTIFAHPRRIALIRFLEANPASFISQMVHGTGVPTTTVIYHCRKLLRRKVIGMSSGKGPACYGMTSSELQESQKALYQIVSNHWNASAEPAQD
jgi:DNA-binding transcriptional ArsR family regulator